MELALVIGYIKKIIKTEILKGGIIMRNIIAMLLAYPIYFTLDFGWTWICVILLQILAGLDFKLRDR
jgi:hypothetical protein